MSKSPDNAFILGAFFNFSLFIVLNAVSFKTAENEHLASGVSMFFDHGFKWGFPFNWGEDFAVILEGGSIFNFGALLIGCVFFGGLFKYIRSEVLERDTESV